MDEALGGRKRLLFIDDEAINLLALRAVFRRSYEVYTAATAFEGLRILEGTRVDAVISDQRMPGMRGTELFASLSKEEFGGARIILTGYESDEDIKSAVKRGTVDVVFAKPLEYRKLVERLERGSSEGADQAGESR